MSDAATPQEAAGSVLSSHALLGMGLYVVEIRTRRRNKNLTDWFPIAAFIKHDMAEDFHEQYAEIGYARILLPNSPVRSSSPSDTSRAHIT